jgi:hypothetical protein
MNDRDQTCAQAVGSRLLTIRDAADQAGVSITTVRRRNLEID